MYIDKSYLNIYTRKLKWIAMFFLIFSTYIILNDSIGFSSAPFYVLHSFCTWQVPSEDCTHMNVLANGIYGVEMIGGFLMAIQASTIYIVVDHPN
jgi:hypothetical protein